MNYLITILALVIVTTLSAQVQSLDEVVVKVSNYKYLNAVDNSEAPVPVKRLEMKAANYDVSDKDLYIDEDNTYNVSFSIPEGKIVAAYDDEGNIVKTIEKFKNVRLPLAVRNALSEKYSGWNVVKDMYVVNYSRDLGALKVYEIKLTKLNEIVKVRLDQNGNYL